VHLRDLVYLEDLPDLMDDLINIDKMKRIYSVVLSALAHRSTYEVMKVRARGTAQPTSPPQTQLDGYATDIIFVDREEDELVSLSGELKPYLI
jgi:hypothetical protein